MLKSVKHFLIYAEETHKKKEGSIILMERFENQSKANQVFKVHSVPCIEEENFCNNVQTGDQLIIHFNVVVNDYDPSGNKITSQYHIMDNIYYVPDQMVHGVIKKSGKIIMAEEWNLISPIRKEMEETASGIITKLNNDKMKLKKDIMFGNVLASNIINDDVKVVLQDHSDYEITIPNKGDCWLVRDNMILAIDED